MSKSLGNSPDPLDLIKDYGADGVRVGMLFSSPAGNDLLFDVKLCEQGRNFSNKIWNAFRLVQGWEVDAEAKGDNQVAIDWFESRFNQALQELNDYFEKFRISDALMVVYKLIWDDFCSWYLEMVKPPYQQPIDKATLQATITFFEKLMKMLHPFMPFITEEIWHKLQEREEKDCIIIADWPKLAKFDKQLIKDADLAFEVIKAIRNLRQERQISPKTVLPLAIKTNSRKVYEQFSPVLHKLANLEQMDFTDKKLDQALNFVVKTDEFFISIEENIDVEAERERITKDLEYQKGFLKSIEKKMQNEKFVNNAPPQVVENEKKKLADTKTKILLLEESLKKLK
jgi:valyl-tRNA synthetase